MRKIQFKITSPNCIHNTYGLEFFIPSRHVMTHHEQLFKEFDRCIRKLNTEEYKDFKSLSVFFQGTDKGWRYYEFLATSIDSLEKQEIVLKYAQWFLDEFADEIELVNVFSII